MSNEIVIYEADNGSVSVTLAQETVWLTQRQLAELLGSTPENILMHLRNIYRDAELDASATTKDFLAVRTEGKRQVQRTLKHYNLDAIISVAYRVNSRRGVQFRQWATALLKQHLTQGYTLNRERFEANARELEAALELVRKTARAPSLASARQHLQILKAQLMARGEASDLFARERGDGLAALLGNLQQSVFGEPAYPSLESRAAHLLYFVVKNHPFADGNKRSGAYLFVDFLHRNGRLLDAQGNPLINDTGLAALTLLVAESAPAQKDTLIRLIMNMLAPEPRP